MIEIDILPPHEKTVAKQIIEKEHSIGLSR